MDHAQERDPWRCRWSRSGGALLGSTQGSVEEVEHEPMAEGGELWVIAIAFVADECMLGIEFVPGEFGSNIM